MVEHMISKVQGEFDDDLFVQMLEVLPSGHSFVFTDMRSWTQKDYDRVINDMRNAGYKAYELDGFGYDENDIDINYMSILKEYHDPIKSNDGFRITCYCGFNNIFSFNLTYYIARVTFKG